MKTISLKKVAAVAVTVLATSGISVISAPSAFALADETANLTVFATSPTTATAVSGTASIDIYVGANAALTAAAGFTVIPTNTSRPSGASAPTVSLTSSGAAAPFATSGTTADTSTLTTSGAGLQSTANGTSGGTLGTISGGVGTKIGVLTVTGFDKAGIYRVTVTPDGAGTDTAVVLNIPVGYSAGGTVNVNKAFPIQGSNITTGWAATSGGQATVRITNMAASTTYYVTTDTGAILSGTGSNASGRVPTAATVTLTNGTNLGGGFNFATSAGVLTSDSMDVAITDTGSPATTTVSVKTFNATTGASSTFVAATVTWGVAAAPSAQYSLLTLNTTNGTTATGAAADTTATIASSSNSSGAVLRYTIQVVVNDQYNVAYTGATLAAKIDGNAGSLGISGTSTTAGGVAGSSLSATMTSSSIGSIGVYSNGVSGKAVITITATTSAGVSTTLGTKTVTFAGSAAKATVTQNLFVAKAGTQLGVTPATTKVTEAGVSTTPALTAEVMDSNGNDVVAGATVKITSSDPTVIVAGTCVELSVDADPSTTGAQPAPGIFECPVSGAVGAASGKSATITFSVYSSSTASYSIVATPITFTIGGAIAKSVIATDKASYTAGEALTLTATSTDSSGNKAYDGQTPFASISSNKGFGGTNGALSLTGKEIVNGKYSTTSSKGVASVFAPSTPGAFTISGLATDLLTGTAYSVTGAVADGNAALLTQIDALNAKIVALNALIAKIMKKLGVK